MVGGRKAILVVEDDTTLREVIAEVLTGEGYQVVQACQTAQALEQINSEHPNLVLLDMALPGRSGLELLEEVKRAIPTREIPVLIMSGYALVLSDDIVMQQADGTVAKPFDVDDLLARVEQLISR